MAVIIAIIVTTARTVTTAIVIFASCSAYAAYIAVRQIGKRRKRRKGRINRFITATSRAVASAIYHKQNPFFMILTDFSVSVYYAETQPFDKKPKDFSLGKNFISLHMPLHCKAARQFRLLLHKRQASALQNPFR